MIFYRTGGDVHEDILPQAWSHTRKNDATSRFQNMNLMTSAVCACS